MGTAIHLSGLQALKSDDVRRASNDPFLKNILGPHQVWRTTLGTTTQVGTSKESLGTTSQLARAAYQAYTAHAGLCLLPEVLWFSVVSEIGEHIRQNSQMYSRLLGADWDHNQQRLRVLSIRGENLFDRFYSALSTIAGGTLKELFAPELSTVDTDERLALICALMDAVGPHRKVQAVAASGIPYIQIDGTPDDWKLLHRNTHELMKLFPALTKYLEVVADILNTIHGEVVGYELNVGNFWHSLYRRPGTPKGEAANGWLTGFVAHQRNDAGKLHLRNSALWYSKKWRGMRIWRFPTHVNAVPILVERGQQEFPRVLVGGILGTTLSYLDSMPVLAPRLGWGMMTPR